MDLEDLFAVAPEEVFIASRRLELDCLILQIHDLHLTLLLKNWPFVHSNTPLAGRSEQPTISNAKTCNVAILYRKFVD